MDESLFPIDLLAEEQEEAAEEEQEQETQQFLSLYLTSEKKALLPTEQLVEILNLDFSGILPVPDTKNSVIGVFNWRQQITWLIDVAAALGLKSLLSQRNLSQNAIVIKARDHKLGIAVKEIGQMIRCQPDRTTEMILDAEEILNLIADR